MSIYNANAMILRGTVILAVSLSVGRLPAMTGRAWPDSSARIVVFADQLPEGLSEAQRRFAAAHLAGTQKMRVSEIRALRVYNPNFLCLHYQLALGCGVHAFIVGDQWTSDWAYVNSQESWFLHNSLAQRVRQTVWDWDVMNVTGSAGAFNTGFPEYWMTTCLERIAINENDGVFADSFTADAYFDQCNPSHPWFQDVGQCLAQWVPSLNAYGAAIRNRFEVDGRGYRFLPNLGALITAWDATDYSLGHGGMIEGFCFWEAGAYFDPSDWQLQLERALALARSNRIVICQSYIGDASNINDRLFALASYLLIKGAHTYINLMAASGLEYYPEYTLSLGSAVGGMPSGLADLWDSTWQVYRRSFANALVLVNPGNTAVPIVLPGSNYLLVAVSGGGSVNEDGAYIGGISAVAVTSLTVTAHSGVILLKSSDDSAPTPVAGDFDGDRLADPALYWEETGLAQAGTWAFLLSARGYQRLDRPGLQGSAGWSAMAGDVDGDRLADPVIYEPASAAWSALLSSAGDYRVTVNNLLGGIGWSGLMGDFDGDSKADPAVCDAVAGRWIIRLSTAGYGLVAFEGFPTGDGWRILTGDFDGDNKADPAACRTISGTWSVMLSSMGYARIDIPHLVGEEGDVPLAADFDGDGLADPAVCRPADCSWRILLSMLGYYPIIVNAW